MEILNSSTFLLIAVTTIGSLIGTSIFTLLKSYFTEKGKNIATKQDIKAITDKIEGVKDEYNRSMENYKSELKKNYDLSKPSLDLTINLDKELIDRISVVNNLIFEFIQLKNYDIAVSLLDEIAALSQFLVKYRIRYKNLNGVEEVVKAQNELARMRDENAITENGIEQTFNSLSHNLDKLLKYFLVTINKDSL